jgi:GGDEF domain-containing protein
VRYFQTRGQIKFLLKGESFQGFNLSWAPTFINLKNLLLVYWSFSMKRLRLWTTILIIWLIFLFNIERINSPINIRDYTYVFVALTAVVTLMLPRLKWFSYWVLLAASIVVFLGYKEFWERELIWGVSLPLTVTQISAIGLTAIIARQISVGLGEFEEVISSITFGQIGARPKPFSEMQGGIYAELKRARRYQRPLSIVSLKIDEQSIRVALPKMIKAVQQAMMKEYVFANVSKILDDSIDDFGTITLRDNHFLVVLPEKTSQEASLVAHQLAQAINGKMELNLQTGMANFPDDAITFEALIERAVRDVAQEQSPQPIKQSVAERPKQELAISQKS